MKLQLVKVKVKTIIKKKPKAKVFRWTRPRVLWANLPGDVVAFDIDFCERWHEVARGGGEGYETIYFSDGATDTDPNANTIEVRLYFNKPVRITGQNDKRLWSGIAQGERSFQTCWRKRSVARTGKKVNLN